MKIRKIKHSTNKFFGFQNEKWAKGGGKYGYGGPYGRNKHGGGVVDLRSREELRNSYDRKHIDDIINGDC